jgi:catechol 2,3-dioxygenase-like lactoylglutathione lyase family enzyme
MNVVRTMFVLAVPNLERSCAFYRDVLGFDIREIGDPGWRMYVRGACRILAGECPDAIPPGQLGDHSYFAYLVVDDVDALHAGTSGAAEVVKTLATEPWGMREFGIRTVDGHRLMFGQEVDAHQRAGQP